MIAESVYSKKFSQLESFSEEIFTSIKKEIKREITARNSSLQRKLGIHSVREMKETAQLFLKKIIAEGDDELGEWVASAWINRHGEIFQCFHEHLTKILADYDELTELPAEAEEKLVQEAVLKFGALNVYIFSVLNSVVFSEKRFDDLKALAQKKDETKAEASLEGSLEEVQKKFESQIQKLLEKQEKRVLGITERHQKEVAGYRKQISQLQKKLEGLCAGS